jgi:hypothetical protein
MGPTGLLPPVGVKAAPHVLDGLALHVLDGLQAGRLQGCIACPRTAPGWTVVESYWALGRLGGHQNRKNGPAPGWLVLGRGWALLHAMVEGVEAMARCRDRAGVAGERAGAGPQSEGATDGGFT